MIDADCKSVSKILHLAHGFFFSPSLAIFSQKSQGLLKLKLYAKLFRLNAIRLISFEKKENG